MDLYSRHATNMQLQRIHQPGANLSDMHLRLNSIDTKSLFDLVFISIISIVLCCSNAFVCFKLICSINPAPLTFQRAASTAMSMLDVVGGVLVLVTANFYFRKDSQPVPRGVTCAGWIAINVVFLASSAINLGVVACKWRELATGGALHDAWVTDRKALTLMAWTVVASTFYLYTDFSDVESESMC